MCGTCFNIYTLLDWSRQTLGQDDAHGASVERKNAPPPRSQQGIRPKRLLVQSDSLPNLNTSPAKSKSPDSSTSLMSKTQSVINISRTSSPPSRNHSRGGGGRRPPANDHKSTWKSYTKSEKNNTATTTSSSLKGEDFVHMDEYLRCGGKAVAEKKAKKKSELARNRIGELAMSLDGGSSIASNSSGWK